jgi:hypothetical protein
VLTVAVHLGHIVIAVLERIEESRLDGAADAEVEGVVKDLRPSPLRDPARIVGRAVVDHEHVESRRVLADRPHDAPHARRLVVGGHHCQV